ncbi:unnamed protein product [Rotaria socialis]|uniref:G-protein coupled receptors family 1 profile domain-containing protein n=1 Tax=Rotaria socialis TaxID=392032 RepID=A0A817PU65_9BILA|nr:unnamed protein product [Rotaria socialis]CAF3315159.1 unnamed protein product [Rotaria socialis]CAF3320369.1 unnamed protein product [Rotaria socialis]CAF3326750.1 unnamed protein product [Rotaria socialis]CAF3470809.1 unnamed protein product [Rotaria socialis]
MTSDNDIYRWYADVIVYRGFGPLIACLGTVGGILSLFVFRRKSLRKKSCSIYFFYLALADLLCMICWLVHFVLPTYNIHILTLSNFFCKIFVFAMYFAFDLANYILTVCSIDRAISVLCPIQSRKFCRERTAYIITFILVIIHTILNSHLLYGFVVLSARTISTPPIRICHHRVDSETYRNFFSMYDSYVDVIKTNAIPFIIMFVCNVIIIIRVCRSKSLMKFNGKNRCRKAKKRVEKDRQLTLMLLGSAIAFLVLTLPTEINDIIRSHSQEKVVTEKAYLLSAVLLSLAHLNYAIHFYIYTLTGDVFRQQLLKLWLINAAWPYIVALRRCKLSPLPLTSETTMNQRTSVRNNQSTQMDMLPFSIKMNDDNDSLT